MITRILSFYAALFCIATTAHAAEFPRWNAAIGPRIHTLVGDGYADIPTTDAPIGKHRIGTGFGAQLSYRFTAHIATRLVAEAYVHGGDVGSARTAVDLLGMYPLRDVEGFAFVRYGRQGVTHPPVVDPVSRIPYSAYVGNLVGAGLGAQYHLTRRISLSVDVSAMYCRLHARVRDDPSDIHDALPEKRNGATWSVTLLSVGYHW